MTGRFPHLLVVSGIPPSSLYGGGIVLRGLLAGYPPENLTIATCGDSIEALESQMAGKYDFRGEYLLFRHFRKYPRFVGRLLWAVKIIQITLVLCRRVFTCSGPCVLFAIPSGWRIGPDLFVAAYLCALLTRTPLIIYEMDDWRDSLGKSPERIHLELEKFFHRRILRKAKLVWVCSKSMAEQFRARFDIASRVLTSAVDVDRYLAFPAPRKIESDEIRLLYTGAVYGAQADALGNVLSVLPSLTEYRVTFYIYSAQSAEELAAYGLSGLGLSVEKAVPPEQMPSLLASADVLILPFAFQSEERTTVSQSFPSKTADYLASGVPILVHAPPYATITQQARQDGWAEIVDEVDTERLASALRRLFSDNERRAELSANARRIALRDHNLNKRRTEFTVAIQTLAGFHQDGIADPRCAGNVR